MSLWDGRVDSIIRQLTGRPLQSGTWIAAICVVAYILEPPVTAWLDSINPFGLVFSSHGRKSRQMNLLRRRKRAGRYTVGLANAANDCFANSNIQALASLPLLYTYLGEIAPLPQADVPPVEASIEASTATKGTSSSDSASTSTNDITERTSTKTDQTESTNVESTKIAEITDGKSTDSKSTESTKSLESSEGTSTVSADTTSTEGTSISESVSTTATTPGPELDVPSPSYVPAPVSAPTPVSASPRPVSAPPFPPPPVSRSATASPGPRGAATFTVPLFSRALLKMMADLNEPIMSPKTLSPWGLLVVLETIYKSRISRSQHDAHELLHLVLETLQNEHEALTKGQHSIPEFVFGGSTIDRILCAKCGYIPPAKPSPFLVLSLMVPQKRSTNLNSMIEVMSTPEHIQDYGCTNCRLQWTLASPKIPADLKDKLRPFSDDPSRIPPELEAQLPRGVLSSINKSTNMHKLPAILTIHLSRSIYGGFGASRNSCKVSISETLLLYENDTPVNYRLMAVIRHKGTHQMGHYECFRRKSLQWWRRALAAGEEPRELISRDETASPASMVTPALVSAASADDISAPEISSAQSSISSPGLSPIDLTPIDLTPAPAISGLSPAASPPSTSPENPDTTSLSSGTLPSPSKLPYPSERSMPSPASVSVTEFASPEITATTPLRAENLPLPEEPASGHEWWKVSDEKTVECNLRDVLREESGVYLLFYEKVEA